LTADVDFSYLKTNLGEDVITVGPIKQSDFLCNMGIETRLQVSIHTPRSLVHILRDFITHENFWSRGSLMKYSTLPNNINPLAPRDAVRKQKHLF